MQLLSLIRCLDKPILLCEAPGLKFDRRLPQWIAGGRVERMRLARWLIIKRPPDPPHSTPGK
jgi:hypothetical protein